MDVLAKALTLRKSGKIDEALTRLVAGLRTTSVAEDDWAGAGRLIGDILHQWPAAPKHFKVLLLGQCTTTWLKDCLTAVSWARGLPVLVEEGQYDNVMQELLTPAITQSPPDFVVFVPWHHTPLTRTQEEDQTGNQLSFWRQVWDRCTEVGARIIQVGYDSPLAGARGQNLESRPGGKLEAVRRLNDALRDHLPSGGFFVDMERVAGEVGRRAFYDQRRYAWTKQPFSDEGALLLAKHIQAGLRTSIYGSKKVLVLDLDNTLWGGVVGELGPVNVVLGETPDGEAFRSFQKYALDLSRRGVLLAVCSKNNPDDAREPFQKNESMILSLDDIAAFEASWDPKSVAIRRIAATLNLGLDSFVFFDDSPSEREEVRLALPEVEVIDVPEDPTDYVKALDSALFFEAVTLTSEDLARTGQYRQELRRKELESSSGGLEGFLSSLCLRAEVAEINAQNMQRVAQLISKTNQFNLTTRRHSQADLEKLLENPQSVSLVVSVKDKFGDYGLVGVVIGTPLDGQLRPTLKIDTWLMSCRVIARTIEEFLLHELCAAARDKGFQQLIGEYLPTAKNGIVKDMYSRMRFSALEEKPGTGALFAFDLHKDVLPTTYVNLPAERMAS